MKRILLAGVAALALGGAAQAQTLVDRLVAGFQERGFTSIEVNDEGRVIAVEAVRDGVTALFLYDAETGELISREVTGNDGDDNDGDDGDDDGEGSDGEDRNRGHGNDADGFDDDNPGRGHDRADDGDDNGRDNRGGGNGNGRGRGD